MIKKRFKTFSEKYDRGKLLGKGAFGHVYQCWLTGSGGKREVHALKILKKNLLSQKPALDDLLVNEFQILMKSKHPHIVRMFDIFQDRQNFYVVQELLKGGDLYGTLAHRSFTEDEAA